MPKAKDQGSVERIYSALREMAISFRLRPGQRVNEVAISRELGASRTPLREALNRLASEGFLRFERGRGFFRRDLKPRDVFELYQLRMALETFAAREACTSASPEELTALAAFLDQTADSDGRRNEELLAFDERFHEAIMGFTRNSEMLGLLKNLNARIRFFRWVDLEDRRVRTQSEHRGILEAIAAGNPDLAEARMREHITRRREEIAVAVTECHWRLFLVEDFDNPGFLTDSKAEMGA